MRFIELHDYRDDSVSIASDLIASVEGVDSPYCPNQRTVVRIRMGDKLHSLAIRESYAEVMALIAGTATAEQATAERADLDERLAALEMARDNLLADYRELQQSHQALLEEVGELERKIRNLAADVPVVE